MSFTSFNIDSVKPATAASSFNHGEEYPAVIAGLWWASTEYQGNIKDGVCIIVGIEDDNKRIVYRSMFVSLTGYVLGQNAGYARLMRGLLRCSDADAELKKKIVDAGLGDISSLVGRPCLARMCIKEKGDKSWASIEALQGETARYKGLPEDVLAAVEPVDVEKVAGKFIKIKALDDCKKSAKMRIITNDGDGLSDVYKEDITDSIF